ncbi:hypothetical protein CL614_01955 [archaeon]|nr:hypothetical protein [archaeon]|tara:strand:+ start:1254 stop:1487 length:234 start_codon:yes stop_codon:yes gene_type:complete
MFGRKKKAKPRRKPAKKAKRKPAKKSGGKKKPFGGYAVNFAGREETLEQVFGKGDLPPSQMTKKLWKFIKAKRLSNK